MMEKIAGIKKEYPALPLPAVVVRVGDWWFAPRQSSTCWPGMIAIYECDLDDIAHRTLNAAIAEVQRNDRL